MESLARFVHKYSLPIIIVTICITIVMGYFAAQIEIKAGLKEMLPESSPEKITYEKTNELFGGVNYVVIMVEGENVLEPATLRKIEEMTGFFESSEDVEGVTSLTNVKSIKGDLWGIELKPLIAEIPETEEEIQELRELLLAEEEYIGSIVTEDFTSTIIMVRARGDIENPEYAALEFKRIAMSYAGPEKIYIAGSAVLANEAAEYMKMDLAKLLPFVLIVITLILWASFKSIRGVILPLVTVVISVIWSIGFMQLMGKSLSMISTALPVLLVSVGSAYAIHITARYFEELEAGHSVSIAVENTIKKVGIAVLMAGGTTIAGFGSLLFSNIVIIKDFAIATAFGVGVVLVISILFVPAVFLHLTKPQKIKSSEDSTFSNQLFKGVYHSALNYRPVVLGVVTLLIFASILVLPNLKPETNYISYFKPHSEPRVAAELISEKFGGSFSLEVVIHGNISDPMLLTTMSNFQDEVEKVPGLSKPLSMVTVLRETNKAFNGNDPEYKVIPTDGRQIAQYLLLLSMSDRDFTKDLVTFDESSTRMQFRLAVLGSKKMDEIIQQVEGLIDQHFGQDYLVELTGMPVLTSALTRMIVHSQLRSLLASIIFTFVITSLLLKSIRRGLLCTLPIMITIMINFGVMGWLGISLDIATAMIASIAVGIGVDYSIHILTRYLEEKEIKKDGHTALNIAVSTVGRANLYNALAVIAGFCVILFSSFPPLVNFGGLTALTMLVSFFGAVLFLPTMLIGWLFYTEKHKKDLEANLEIKR